ncbi:uncharacterized protein LOC116290480 [Actinia tenebrosa]|uniref:Uncharacterized protein LOC116290480 n=1 Tax=Actinia tenebrosa TaxID=6105 RepID=A0A6P8HED6_ACTTE|nr:uncharacterized protein LOC116290480 [Actinia tenebrosa]
MAASFQNHLIFWSLVCHGLRIVQTERGCSDILPHYCKRLKVYLGPLVCRTTNPSLRKLVTTKCLKTCGFCRQMYPIDCRFSQWGCCWDGLTPRDDRHGYTCPKCRDKFAHTCREFAHTCREFAYYCSKPDTFSGGFLRMACPVTCGRCSS